MERSWRLGENAVQHAPPRCTPLTGRVLYLMYSRRRSRVLVSVLLPCRAWSKTVTRSTRERQQTWLHPPRAHGGSTAAMCITPLVLATVGLDSCGFSCRYRSAQRIPTYMIPLELLACTANPHCGARNKTASQIMAPRPDLYVAMTTIPPRAGKSLRHAIDSLFAMRRRPDRVLVSAAGTYRRFPGARVNLSATLSARDGLVERLDGCEDAGPGTKLLCALPRLRALARSRSEGGGSGSGGSGGGGGDGNGGGNSGGGGSGLLRAGSDTFAVLMDDDLKYKPWALQWVERAIRDDPGRTRHAYSYDVYTITSEGRAVIGGLYPGLLVGAGHALFAIRLSLLDGLEEFAACVRKLEPRSL